jgi:hypothetical protein
LQELINILCNQGKLPAPDSLNFAIKSKIVIPIIIVAMNPCRGDPYNIGFSVGAAHPAKPYLLATVFLMTLVQYAGVSINS